MPFFIVGAVLRVAHFASNNDCSNPSSFRDMTFFHDFNKNFSENLDFQSTSFQPTSFVLRRCSKCDCPNALSFHDVTFVMS